MKKILKLRFVIFILSILAIMLTACSSSSQHRFEVVNVANTNIPEQKIKLRFISSWGGEDPKAATLQEILNKFMEDNKDVEVINESMSGEDFLNKIKADFASGYDPDVFGLWPGSDIRELIRVGKVSQLDVELSLDLDWKRSFNESVMEYTTYDDKVYGLPLEIIYECLFVNKDLFENYNVKIPENYEELKTAAKVFKEKGIIPIAYNSTPEGSYIYQNIAMKLGGKDGVENPFINGRVNDCYINAMGYVKELNDIGAFPKDYTKISDKQRNDLFISKKAAMMVSGSWLLGSVDNTVKMVSFPTITGGKAAKNSLIYGLGCGAFHMSTSTANDVDKKKRSVKLLKALTSRESAQLLAERNGMLSAVSIDDTRKNNYYLSNNEKTLLESSTELIGPTDSFVNRAIWDTVIVNKFPHYLEGTKSAEEIWNEALNRYKLIDAY